jgi:hypothetical protein
MVISFMCSLLGVDHNVWANYAALDERTRTSSARDPIAAQPRHRDRLLTFLYPLFRRAGHVEFSSCGARRIHLSPKTQR